MTKNFFLIDFCFNLVLFVNISFCQYKFWQPLLSQASYRPWPCYSLAHSSNQQEIRPYCRPWPYEEKKYFWRQKTIMLTKFYLSRPSFLVNFSSVIHLPFPHLCKYRWYFLEISISIFSTNLFINILLPLSQLCFKRIIFLGTNFFELHVTFPAPVLIEWTLSENSSLRFFEEAQESEETTTKNKIRRIACSTMVELWWQTWTELFRVSVLQSIEPCQLYAISNDSNLDGYNKAKGELFVAIQC